MRDLEASLGDGAARLLDAATVRGRVLLGVTGSPGAGKSTVTAALVAALPAGSAVVVAMDGFHLAQAALERLGRADRKGAPDTFDAAGFVSLLQRLRHPDREPGDGVVWAPAFDRSLEEPVAGAVPVPPDVPLVVVEGNYLLLEDDPWHRVRPLLDEVWHLAPDPQLRVARLVARHVAHGRSPEAAQAWVLRSDEANARRVEAVAHRADRVVRVP